MLLNSEIVAGGFIFPETPRWHAGRQAFYFVDIDDGKLYELKDGNVRMLSKHRDMVSGMAFDESDGFYITSLSQRKILHLRNWLGLDREVEVVADCSSVATYGLNDMIRGPDGSFYADAINYDALASFSDPSIQVVRSPLVHVAPDGKVSVGSDATCFPNGAVMFPGEQRLLLADSYDACVYAFPVAADGSLGPASVFADLPGELPDGIGGDAEGGLWVATGCRCIRVIEGGQITDEVSTGDITASACMLGGDDGRTLLITGSKGHDRRTLYASTTGVLLSARVEIPGAGLPSLYGGGNA